MTPDEVRIYERCEARWDRVSQLLVLSEECCELAAAISRRINDKEAMAVVVDEAADVQIMLNQFRRLVGTDVMQEAVARKLDKLRRRLDYFDAKEST